MLLLCVRSEGSPANRCVLDRWYFDCSLAEAQRLQLYLPYGPRDGDPVRTSEVLNLRSENCIFDSAIFFFIYLKLDRIKDMIQEFPSRRT